MEEKHDRSAKIVIEDSQSFQIEITMYQVIDSLPLDVNSTPVQAKWFLNHFDHIQIDPSSHLPSRLELTFLLNGAASNSDFNSFTFTPIVRNFNPLADLP